MHLTITPITGNATTQTACGSYTWNGSAYTTSGTYTHVNSTCDVDTLYLIVNHVDTSVTDGANVLTSNATNASFQWYNCDNNVNVQDETSSSFYPNMSGNYSVIVNQNGCVDTSYCHYILIWGLDELKTSQFNISPNPTSDFIYFSNTNNAAISRIEILDLNGKCIKNIKPSETNQNSVSLENLISGVYLIKFKTSQSEEIHRVIKE